MTRGRFFCLYIVFLALVSLPVLTTETLPMLDYPNHLARMWVLYQNGRDPLLNPYYQVHWALFSNLAMDIFVPPLVGMIGIWAAGKAFLIAIFILLTSGCAALHVALWRRWSAWPLLGFAFLYNDVFLLGFTNYLFSAGCALWAMAGWLWLREWRWRWPLFALAAFVLMIFHLFGFGFFGLMVAGHEIAAARKAGWTRAAWRRGLVSGLMFAPAILAFILFSPTMGAADRITLSAPDETLRAMATSITLYDANWQWVVTILLLGAAFRAWRRGALALAPEGGGITLALLAVVFLVMPSTIFGSAYAQFRYWAGGLFIFLALLGPTRAEAVTRLAPVLTLALLALQWIVVGPVWRDSDRQYARLNQAVDTLPRGSRLIVAAYRTFQGDLEPTPMAHHALRAVITRSVFSASLYTENHGFPQPIRLTPWAARLMRTTPWCSYNKASIAAIRAQGRNSVFNPFRPNLMPFYDYALVVNGQAFPFPPPPTSRVVAADGPWQLIKLHSP